MHNHEMMCVRDSRLYIRSRIYPEKATGFVRLRKIALEVRIRRALNK